MTIRTGITGGAIPLRRILAAVFFCTSGISPAEQGCRDFAMDPGILTI
jgi:hypothetical protein